MNERIMALREQSLKTKPHISPERAKLLTEFTKSHKDDTVSAPVKRALVFKYLLEKKKISIS